LLKPTADSAVESKREPVIAMVVNERKERNLVLYGLSFFFSLGFSENSSHPRTKNPIATPVMAIQVPSLSI
jgi:hypothetical protein